MQPVHASLIEPDGRSLDGTRIGALLFLCRQMPLQLYRVGCGVTGFFKMICLAVLKQADLVKFAKSKPLEFEITDDRNKIQKAIPYVAILIGVLFILRGLGLGIPYVSPSDMSLFVQSTPNCH